MVKTRGEKVSDVVNSVCKATSPSKRLTYTGNGNYEIFPDKRKKPTEQATEEIDIKN